MLFMVYPQMIPGKGQPVGSSSVAEVNRSLSGASGVGVGGGALGGVGGGGGGGGGGGREGPSTVGSVSKASSAVKAERFEPRIFGFRVNEEARLSRWRTARRDTLVASPSDLDLVFGTLTFAGKYHVQRLWRENNLNQIYDRWTLHGICFHRDAVIDVSGTNNTSCISQRNDLIGSPEHPAEADYTRLDSVSPFLPRQYSLLSVPH